MNERLEIVIIGLSITSSWGNGHATTYRSLVRHLHSNGHDVLFLERDVPWYAGNRDLPDPPFGRTRLYDSIKDLSARFEGVVRDADLVMVGSYVPEGIAVGDWVLANARGVTAFYDIDTPVTLAQLQGGSCEYISAAQIPKFDLYLSFTGGPILERLQRDFGSPAARPLYCSVDTAAYFPENRPMHWALGYMGTYSPDRQPKVDALLVEPARALPSERFVVAGPQYPEEIRWPENVERIEHLPPDRHRLFYNEQRFTLNVTRDDMVRAGFSPSVRLFEAAACAVPVISDYWQGIESFFMPGREILIAHGTGDVQRLLDTVSPGEAKAIGRRAQERVLSAHTAAHRAVQLESYVRARSGQRNTAAA